jgi:hypothetical protein
VRRRAVWKGRCLDYFYFSSWSASVCLLIGAIGLSGFCRGAGTAIWGRADHHGESSERECWEKRDRGMAPCSSLHALYGCIVPYSFIYPFS